MTKVLVWTLQSTQNQFTKIFVWVSGRDIKVDLGLGLETQGEGLGLGLET